MCHANRQTTPRHSGSLWTDACQTLDNAGSYQTGIPCQATCPALGARCSVLQDMLRREPGRHCPGAKESRYRRSRRKGGEMDLQSQADAGIDPTTLAVVAGAHESSVREMSITMRRAAMSPVLAIGNDFSNCVADGMARMVTQGQDQPVHLGAMIFAVKEVAAY